MLIESIIDLYKAECIDTDIFHAGLQRGDEVEYARAGWVDWYIHRQLHSSLSSATEFEQAARCAALKPQVQPT